MNLLSFHILGVRISVVTIFLTPIFRPVDFNLTMDSKDLDKEIMNGDLPCTSIGETIHSSSLALQTNSDYQKILQCQIKLQSQRVEAVKVR